MRFAVVGVSGIVVNLAFVWLGKEVFFQGLETDLADGLASGLGIVVSIFTNFLLNDGWTWSDRQKRPFATRLGMYYLGAAAAAGLQFALFALLRYWLGVHVYLAQLSGIALGTLSNYVVNNYWVFKNSDGDSSSGRGNADSGT